MTNKQVKLRIRLEQLEKRKKLLQEILEFGKKNILFAECIAKRNNPSKILISSPYVKIALLSELNAIDKALFYLEELETPEPSFIEEIENVLSTYSEK